MTATVIDSRGRFVPGLEKDDFRVYEDGEPQTVTHFSNERVPVSLGIALDTSGSMDGDKMVAARNALDRFLYDLLDSTDEIFLYQFSYQPILVQDWTTDRTSLTRALGRIRPRGGTALYDTVAEAVPMAQTGRHQKKALVIISDGNDTNSSTDVRRCNSSSAKPKCWSTPLESTVGGHLRCPAVGSRASRLLFLFLCRSHTRTRAHAESLAGRRIPNLVPERSGERLGAARPDR